MNKRGRKKRVRTEEEKKLLNEIFQQQLDGINFISYEDYKEILKKRKKLILNQS